MAERARALAACAALAGCTATTTPEISPAAITIEREAEPLDIVGLDATSYLRTTSRAVALVADYEVTIGGVTALATAADASAVSVKLSATLPLGSYALDLRAGGRSWHVEDALEVTATGAPGSDADGDGVPDATDDCPTVANLDQHDEDGDRVGDACDPCPQIANATTDSDGDGIADACDPHPATAGDRLAWFEPFSAGTTLPAGWIAKAGPSSPWKVDSDALSLTAGSSERTIVYDTGTARHAVDVGFDLANASSEQQAYVTVLTDSRSDLAHWVACGLRADLDHRQLLTYNAPTFTALAPSDSTEPLAVPGAYRVLTVMDAAAERCIVPSATAPHELTGTAASQGDTFIGLRVLNASVAFRYVAIYTF
jgi:hypothetical protein